MAFLWSEYCSNTGRKASHWCWSIPFFVLNVRPNYLETHRDVLYCLTEIWLSNERQTRLMHEESLPLHQVQESKLMVKCFLTFCKVMLIFLLVCFNLFNLFIYSLIFYMFIYLFFN
jgi:hypothetical protein